jgi:ABC-type ATPase involved in cell division
MNKFKLDITGLFGRTDFTLEMDRPVKYLTGLNGAGKTTILRLLTAIYCRDSKTISNIPFETLSYDDGDYSFMTYKKTPDGAVSLPDKPPAFRYIHVPEQYEHVFRRMHDPYRDKPGSHRLFCLEDTYVMPDMVLGYLTNPKTANLNDERQAMFRLLWEETHGYLRLPEIGAKFPFCFVSKKTGELVSSEYLSQGEQRWFMLLYAVIFLVQEGDVLMIDSPEKFLHVAWQKRLMDIIGHFLAVRPFYCLIATHSPMIICEDWENTIDIGVNDAILKKDPEKPKEDDDEDR